MRIELNGREVEVSQGASIADLVAEARAGRAEARGIAVAVDGEVVPRGSWAKTRVAEGQSVEVLEAIQGG
jgi:sulfur carrier protein